MGAPTYHPLGQPKPYEAICAGCQQLKRDGDPEFCECGADPDQRWPLETLLEEVARLDEVERENGRLKRDLAKAQETIEHYASTLAYSVRVGTGVNLQASLARNVLESHGVKLDRQGWRSTESGFDPSAPPWKER